MWDKIRLFLIAPVFEDDEEKTRAAAVLNPILFGIFVVALISAIATVFMFNQKLGSGIAVGVVVMILLVAKLLLQRGYVRTSAVLFLIGVWIPWNTIFVLSGQKSMIGAGNISLIVIAGLVLGRGGAITIAVASSLLSMISVVADRLGMPFPVFFPPSLASSWMMLTFGLVLAVIPLNMALGLLNDALGRSRQYVSDLEAQQGELQILIDDQAQEAKRRAAYLSAATAISSEAVSVERDPQELLDRVVRLISERFGFYHTGIFLLDANKEWAILQAASSEGGQRMLARGHRLRAGVAGVGQGIVGDVAHRGEYRVAIDVGEDATFFDNPDLPETRSEIALPLRVRDDVIGVLDVQSIEADAFSTEDVTVLQALADQVAVAINNVQLFQQVEESVEAERRAYGNLTREAWQALLRVRPDLAFVSDASGTAPFAHWEPQMKEAVLSGHVVSDAESDVVAVPIRLRDQVIGVIDGRKPDGTSWSEDEIGLLQALTDQFSTALEGARLYEATQRRAAREGAIREIADEMQRATDIDSLLRITAEALNRTLHSSRVYVRMVEPESTVKGEAQSMA